MPDRTVRGLNPSTRPRERPTEAPPSAPPATTQGASTTAAAEPSQATHALQRSRGEQPRGRRRHVMHSVPGETLDALRQHSSRTGRSYSDLAIEAVLGAFEQLEAEHGTVADHDSTSYLRRRVATARGRPRRDGRGHTVQLTLYLTDEERDELDSLAGRLRMTRSGLVTEALHRELEHLT